jgi:cystathionine gamma-synthase
MNVPVTFTSTYIAEGPISYARVGNPTWAALEEVIGRLEGGTALTFASGMAAIAAVVDEVCEGGVVVAPIDSYTGTRFLLDDASDKGRLDVRLVDLCDSATVAAALAGATVLWIESPTNPMLSVPDVAQLAAAARTQGATVVVDNTFATPLVQRPLQMGADIVVHSATKYLSGHSDLLMGVAVCSDDAVAERLHLRRTLTGAIPGPMEAYLALRGLRTLHVRVERATANAGELARRLGEHPRVTRVRYPGFGAVVAFEVGGDADAAERACAATRLIVHSTSLGGVETTMERRRRHPGEQVVPDDLIRVSVGIEHVDDLWSDLAAALDAM